MIKKVNKLVVFGLFLILGLVSISVSAQRKPYSSDISEPHLLYSADWSGDVYEMLNHSVWDLSWDYFVDNNKRGRLVARICSNRPFDEAMVTTFFNPKESIWGLVRYRRFIYEESLFLASYSGCSDMHSEVNRLENWLVPEGTSIEVDEIYGAATVEYIDSYELMGEVKETADTKARFERQLAEFIVRLKEDKNRKGFVARTSTNRTVKRNVSKVMAALASNGVDPTQVKQILYKNLEDVGKGNEFKLAAVYSEDIYPRLITIRK